jgi:DNA-binding protein H-NS
MFSYKRNSYSVDTGERRRYDRAGTAQRPIFAHPGGGSALTLPGVGLLVDDFRGTNGQSRGMDNAHRSSVPAKLRRNWAYSTRPNAQGWVMADLQQLIRQKADLERQIAQLNSKGRQDAIDEIRKIMTEHGLTSDDIASPTRARKAGTKLDGTERKAVAAKYKDDQGNQWTGRGLKPRWLTAALAAGKKLEDFGV